VSFSTKNSGGHLHAVAVKFPECFYCALFREPRDLIIVDMSVHVSTCTSYDFNALMPVVCQLWH